jgi:hypothetical protein
MHRSEPYSSKIVQNNDDWKDIPFDINNSKVGNTESMQKMLAPAICSTTDAQGGVRFASIDTEADGYSYDVVSVPGMDYGAIISSLDESSNSDSISSVSKELEVLH